MRLFDNEQRVKWTSPIGTLEKGTIRALLLAKNNPHLKEDSYLIEMDFNGMIVATPIQSKLEADEPENSMWTKILRILRIK